MDLENYLDFVSQVIKANADPSDASITAARLGVILRSSNPEQTWQSFGFASLSALLRVMQDRAMLKVGPNQKQALTVWAQTDSVAHAPVEPRPRYNPLRKPFWVAFVLEQPLGRRFVHRRSGEVRLGLAQPPSPADEWIEVEPIKTELQRSWAQEFLRMKSLGSDPRVAEALGAHDWFMRFPTQLEELQVGVGRDWNRYRSQKVSEQVEKWCLEAGVDREFVFQTSGTMVSSAKGASKPIERPTAGKDDSVRRLVLGALAQLPTEYLLEIPIPAKYLLSREAGAASK